MGILNSSELKALGFLSLGDNVRISNLASFHNCAHISIGNNVRIDDFCVLSAGEEGIYIGDYIHIGVNSSLLGAGKITLSDFSGLSSRVSIYSSSDDYTGRYLTNPTVPKEYTDVTHGAVFIGRHVIIGSGSVVLPNVTISEGAAIGALSLVKNDCEPFSVCSGNPAVKIKERRQDLLKLEQQLLSQLSATSKS